MKKVIVIALSSLFFLILVGLVVYKLFSPSTPTKQVVQTVDPFKDIPVSAQAVSIDTPYRTVVSCYTWYISAIAHGALQTDIITRAETRRCFSAKFIESWKENIISTETSPVVLSEGYFDSWLTSVSAQIVSQLSETSNVELVLGSGTEAQNLSIALRRSTDGWEIDSVF